MKINYIGELFENTGYGEAARNTVALLSRIPDIELNCIPIGAKTTTETEWKFNIVKDRVVDKTEKADITIYHFYPPLNIKDYIHKDSGKIVSYIAWETDMLSSKWVYNINKYSDIVITTCEEMKKVFIKSGINIPVYVLGPTIFEEDIPTDVQKIPMQEMPHWLLEIVESEDVFIFYSIFQWIERKDPIKLLSAFMEEFDSVENVMLLLKTYRANYSEEETKKLLESVRYLNKELNVIYPPKIRIISNKISQENIKIIHRASDCYVNAGRGEGTGLPIIDAILHENLAVVNPYGGPQDFTQENSSIYLDYKMIPIRQPLWQGNYFNCNMLWGDVDTIDLKNKMRQAYIMNKSTKKKKELAAKEYLLDQYSLEKNINQIKTILGLT